MARIRLLSDDEYVNSLKASFQEAKAKAEKLDPEYDICERAYQCISEGVQGGVDSGIAKQILFSGNVSENEFPLIEGLDLTKAVLFLHSKMCISDPVIQATPRKQDPATIRAASCAQAYLPYMRQRMHLQERLEAGAYLNLVIYGTGIVYNGWDVDGGEFPLDNIPENPEDILKMDFKMEGDYDVRNVHPRKFFVDAAATNWIDAEKCWEEIDVAFEKALFKFPSEEQQEILRAHHKAVSGAEAIGSQNTKSKNNVKIYSYFERGRPWNGFLGSHCYFVCPEEPKILAKGPNPFKHKKLPYSIFTDVDIPDNVFGMSRIIYAYQAQMCINNIMYLIIKNIALFGGNKLMLPEGALNDEAINNSLDSVLYYNSATGGKPEYIRPANVTADVWKAYDIQKSYINNVYGMNEFSQGQIPRELSSYAVQIAMEMDDKYRIRLFNKKKNFLKDIYYQGMENTLQYMTEPRKLDVVGLEQYTDNDYFSSSNLRGDYDIDADYGPYMPVDPSARKQQILEFIKSGFFEKAGGNMQKAAGLLIDGSMLDIKTMFNQSSQRQKVEIDKMIAGEKVTIQPWDKDEDHAAAVEEFSRTETFETLSAEIKQAIWQHGEEHVKRLAEKIAKSKGPASTGKDNPPAEGGAPSSPEGAPQPPNPLTGASPITQNAGPTI